MDKEALSDFKQVAKKNYVLKEVVLFDLISLAQTSRLENVFIRCQFFNPGLPWGYTYNSVKTKIKKISSLQLNKELRITVK